MNTEKPMVIMLDNDYLFLESWRETLGESVDFVGLKSQLELELRLDRGTELLKAKCAIVDFDFGEHEGNAGETGIVDFLRRSGFKGKIVMCSIHKDFGEYDEQIRTEFDAVIKKKPLSWNDLSKTIGI